MKTGLLVCAMLALCGNNQETRAEKFVSQNPKLAELANQYYEKQSNEWLGYVPADWQSPCKITMTRMSGAQGATNFSFNPLHISMAVINHRDTYDSILPHEVLHTVLISHFKRPLPGWINEGACGMEENQRDHDRRKTGMTQYLSQGRAIPFDRMFALYNYPGDVMPLYSQGGSVTKFLVFHSGKKQVIKFMEKAFANIDNGVSDPWTASLLEHYDYKSLIDFQKSWNAWFHADEPMPDVTYKQVSWHDGRWNPAPGQFAQCPTCPIDPFNGSVLQPINPNVPVVPVVKPPVVPVVKPPVVVNPNPVVVNPNPVVVNPNPVVVNPNPVVVNPNPVVQPPVVVNPVIPVPVVINGKDGKDGKDGLNGKDADPQQIQNLTNQISIVQNTLTEVQAQINSLKSPCDDPAARSTAQSLSELLQLLGK